MTHSWQRLARQADADALIAGLAAQIRSLLDPDAIAAAWGERAVRQIQGAIVGDHDCSAEAAWRYAVVAAHFGRLALEA